MTSNRKYSISKVDRRRFLTIFGATGAAALAGCAGGETDDDDEGSSGGSSDDGGNNAASSDENGDEEEIPTGDVELDLGETYEAPNAIEMTVNDFWFQESYTYEDWDGSNSEEYPDDGNQWLFVDVTVLNGANESQFIPTPRDVNVLIGNQQYDFEWTGTLSDATDLPDEYEGGEVEAGIERSGIIMYEVPADATEDDVVVSWSDEEFGEDEWTARWTN